MAHRRIDGVIEAIRYAPDGSIALARLYQRHGPVWSDCILMNRKQLVENLNKGSTFAIGQRETFMGGRFEIGKSIHLHKGNIVIEDRQSGHDHLPGVPVF